MTLYVPERKFWTRQPQDVRDVDWGNSLCKTLVFCAPFNGHYYDVAGDRVITPSSGASFYTDSRGVSLKASGSAAVASAQLNLAAYTKITVSFWMLWDSFANDDKFLLELTSNSNNQNAFSISPNTTSYTGNFGINLTGTAGKYNLINIARPAAGTWNHFLFTMDRTTGANVGITAYVNGVLTSPTATYLQDVPDNFVDSTLYFFSRGGTTLLGAGRIQNVCIRHGIAGANEIAKAEYENPWQIFAPRRQWFAFPPSGQIKAPFSDITTGSWSPSTGSTLYGVIDEASPDASDYITSSTIDSTCEVKFSSITDPTSSLGHLVSYQLLSGKGAVKVALKQGSTEIAAWNTMLSGITQTVNNSLTAAQADSITDYSDLRIAFTGRYGAYYTESRQSNSVATQQSFSAVSLGTPVDGRVIVVVVTAVGTSSGFNFLNLTVNGVLLTKNIEETGSLATAIFSKIISSPASADIVVYGSANFDCAIKVYALYGVAPTPAITISTNNTSTQIAVTSASFTEDDVVIFGGAAQAGETSSTTVSSGETITENFDAVFTANNARASSSGTFLCSTTSSKTITQSGSSNVIRRLAVAAWR